MTYGFVFYSIAFFLAIFITAEALHKLIPALSKYAKQPIYEEGPAWHMSKSGTPTMGGITFLLAAVITLVPASLLLLKNDATVAALSLLVNLTYALANGLTGLIDDITKLRHHENKGLTPVEKLIIQFLLAGLYLFARSRIFGDSSVVYFSSGEVDLGFWYYPLSLLILVGMTNCANLTDGIDGLSSSVAFAIGISMFYMSAALSEEAAFISVVTVGICVGFLFFNLHPAKIFMGDTGSLFLGSLICTAAFSLKNPFIMFFVGGVYVIEGASVILQVTYYKLTHRRIFKMAPIHHHLEKCGMSENRICLTAIFLTLIFSVPAYFICAA